MKYTYKTNIAMFVALLLAPIESHAQMRDSGASVPTIMPYIGEDISDSNPTNTQNPESATPAKQQTKTPGAKMPVVHKKDTTGTKEIVVTKAKQAPKKRYWFAGSEISSKHSAFVGTGVTAPLPIQNSATGGGWFTSLMGYGLGYQYKSGRTIKARSVGTALGFGYSGGGDYGWWNASMGPNVTYTSLSPDVRSNKSRGRHWALNMQLGGERKITNDFKVRGGVSYQAFSANNFRIQLRPLMRVSDNIFIGPEAIYQGGNSYRIAHFGGVITGIDIGYNTQMGIKAGMVQPKGDSPGAYVGLELGRSF